MSLSTNYSDANRTPYNGPDIRYDVDVEYFEGTSSSAGKYSVPLYWTITRTSATSYRYIGMTYGAATQCANELRAKFTRPYAVWSASYTDPGDGSVPTVFVSQNYVTSCKSSITVSNSSGNAYEVNITENNVDVIVSTKELKTDEEMAAAFQLADARDKHSTGSISITAAKWKDTYITVDYETIMTSFDKTLVTVQVKSGELWVPTSPSTRPTDRRLTFFSESNATFRLVYDASGSSPIYSKQWTTDDLATPSFAMVAEECSAVTECSVTSTGGQGQQWVSTYSLVFTSDHPYPGQLTSIKDYTVTVDGHVHTAEYKGDGVYVGYKGIKSIDYLGSNKYRMVFNHFPHAYCSANPCDGTTGSQVSIYNNRFDISTATVNIKLAHYADITALSASGVKSTSGATSVQFTVSFKSSESYEDVMAGAKVYEISSEGDNFTMKNPTEVTRESLTKSGDTYTFVGSATSVGKVYAAGFAYVYVNIEPSGGTATKGIYKSVSWDYATMPKIVAKLTGVAANTTVTPNATTPITGMTFDWDWGDGTVERNLTASPSAHTYTAAGNYTVTVEGGVAEIIGAQAVPYNTSWLAGAESYVTEVSVAGATKLGTRAFFNCVNMTRCVANSATAVDALALYSAGSSTSTLTGVASFRAATAIGQMAFDESAFLSVDITGATTIWPNALRFVSAETEVTIGKPKTEVQAMTNYSFGMVAGNIIHCTDGDINI